jgi:hypothetical protein
MTKISLFRKIFLRAVFFKQPLILKSYEEYKSKKAQKRPKNFLLNNWSMDVGSFVKIIYYPRIQMILQEHLQV